MHRLHRPFRHATWLLSASLVALAAAAFAALVLAPARAATVSSLKQQITSGQSHISSLAGALHAVKSRVARLDSSIAGLRSQIAAIQRDLDAKRSELLKLRSELAAAHARLDRLEAFQSHAQAVLARQLVNSYEADKPDIVFVVLEAHGFPDLLERLAFARRIRDQTTRVLDSVRAARRAVAAEATKLGALEVRQQALTVAVLKQRDQLTRAEVSLVSQQLVAARAQRNRAGALASAQDEVSSLQHRLSALQAAQAAQAARAASGSTSGTSRGSGSSGSSSSGSGSGNAGSGGSGSGSSGPVGAGQVSSGGGFTFPLPTGTASPPGTWSLDSGVDISAPGDTPELAVCSGTIVLHGIGGFGPWAPVLHCDSPLDGYDYVYYGHAGPNGQLAVGTHVGAGQVMSSIGPGIVGISSGPHLELGFADASGAPIGGGSASTMMSLLQSSYGG
jgi:peptidoglycan hydrolase CwlO-like protein